MDVKVDSRGNIYIADMLNQRIRLVDTNGKITTVAGTGDAGRGPDGVFATASALNYPAALALDVNADLYVIDWQNYLIRKITFSSRPSISAGGIVNSASFSPPAAPGALISIFGQSLAASKALAEAAPWPQSLGGTSVQVNGANIPLYFVSPQQINAQLPVETQPGSAAISVINAIGASEPAEFNVSAAAPGIFQSADNRAVAINQDGTLNSPSNPESRGRVVAFYLTGQGPVSPVVPTGMAAPMDSLSTATLPHGASIGGAAAEVQFLGLAPGFIGLAQANVVIPSGAPTGDSVSVVLTVNGQASNAVVISVR
jgi:uncharacterized protein (TIGR03437 family)